MNRLPAIAWVLALAGATPFIALAASLTTLEPVLGFVILERYMLLISYAAIIITFIGAVHWGVAIASEHPKRQILLVYSVLPSLMAWALINVLMAWSIQLTLLAALIVLVFIADRLLVIDSVAQGYGKLRLTLTLIVATSLLAGAALV